MNSNDITTKLAKEVRSHSHFFSSISRSMRAILLRISCHCSLFSATCISFSSSSSRLQQNTQHIELLPCKTYSPWTYGSRAVTWYRPWRLLDLGLLKQSPLKLTQGHNTLHTPYRPPLKKKVKYFTVLNSYTSRQRMCWGVGCPLLQSGNGGWGSPPSSEW